VHLVLGRHRPDDGREGWISGLPAATGETHPTRGGLRIGKALRERSPSAPFDDRLEWNRDGQYFHYLTKWMHALDQIARAAHDHRFNVWARELADTAHRRFTYPLTGGRGKRMYWKMSIDLTRPLVPSMGHRDPLEGLLICLELDETAAALRAPAGGPDLSGAISDFAAMIDPRALATADPLGVGELLVDVQRVARLIARGARRTGPALLEGILDALLAATASGLGRFASGHDRVLPADRRLAARELGLALGLAAVASVERGALARAPRAAWRVLDRFSGLRRELEELWLRPEHRAGTGWAEHEDLNDVMLAAALLAPA
jgi:hypothetical protein